MVHILIKMVIPELRKIINFMNLKMNVIDIHIFEMALISYANANKLIRKNILSAYYLIHYKYHAYTF